MNYRPFPHYLIPYLEREEGEKFSAYRDSAGVLSVGVGHVVKPGEPTTVTQAEINADLATDLITAESRLLVAIGTPALDALSDCQYAALLSFVFNVGADPGWGIFTDIRHGDLSDVPSQMERFVYADGQIVPGLVNRRKADVALWLGTDPVLKLAS
jgi:lysozyme